MNINNFEWAEFKYTIHTFSWWEAGMLICFIISGIVSYQWTKKTEAVDGKSVNALFFLMLGTALGLMFKLFTYLNVTVFLYVALLVVQFLDYKRTREIRNRLFQAEDAQKIKRRRDSILSRINTTKQDGQSAHGVKRSHSHSHGSSSHGEHSHGHSRRHRHGESHSSSAGNGIDGTLKDPKDPLFVDPLQDEE